MAKATVNKEEQEIEIVEIGEIPVLETVKEKKIAADTRPWDQRIIDFIAPRYTGKAVLVNDFLKSLFPVHVGLGRPEYTKQENSKTLRCILEKLVADKKISVQGDVHVRLGKSFYVGEAPETQYYSIANLPIYVELI
jgi:hypothetical protein